MNNLLNEIVESRIQDIKSDAVALNELKARYRDRQDFRPFRESLIERARISGHAAVIAEIKRGSPSKGLFAPELDPIRAAKDYEQGGATCLSVLTEPRYFYGSLNDLVSARKHGRLPVLRKDFIVTEYQIYESALYADAVLLIVRCLEQSQLKDFYDLATSLKLDVLVEIFDEEDIEKIEPFHFPLIGVNHRNLKTMDVSLYRSFDLFRRFDKNQSVVAASGIRSRHDIDRFMTAGIRCFLVGESLSRAANRIDFLKSLVEGEDHAD